MSPAAAARPAPRASALLSAPTAAPARPTDHGRSAATTPASAPESTTARTAQAAASVRAGIGVRPAAQPGIAVSSIVLIAHGSPDQRHAAGIEGIADRIRAGTGVATRATYIEHNTPRAADALALTGAQAGLVVLPLLLTAGFHWRNDIPPVVASSSGRSTLLGPPPLELFAAAVVALTHQHRAARIVVALAGSRSPRLAGRLSTFHATLRHHTELEVRVAPDPGAVASQADPGSLVVPFVVADGIFADRIRSAAGAAGAPVTPVLGGTPGFAAALAQYVQGAAAGPSVPAAPAHRADTHRSSGRAP